MLVLANQKQNGVSKTQSLALSVCLVPSRHPGITGGLVKGALSVAASAYKALFTGQPGPVQVSPPFTSYSAVNDGIQGHPLQSQKISISY